MIVPSILPQSREELETKLALIESYCQWVHLDFVDGKLFTGNSLTIKEANPLPGNFKYELHLMVMDPENTIDQYLALKPRRVWLHVESSNILPTVIDKVKLQGIEIGVVANPETPVEQVTGYFSKASAVLIMSIRPGKTGQAFLPEALPKITIIRKAFPNILLGVDGGINPKTISLAAAAGANYFISSSYIFNQTSIPTALSDLQSAVSSTYH